MLACYFRDVYFVFVGRDSTRLEIVESAFSKGNCESSTDMQIHPSFFDPAFLNSFRYRTAAFWMSPPLLLALAPSIGFSFFFFNLNDSSSLIYIKQLSISFYLPHFLSKSHLLSSLLPKISHSIPQLVFSFRIFAYSVH